jgi:hypothetical protein
MTDSTNGSAAGGAATTSSHLFLVRLWVEDESSDQPAWCGKVQHVTSGEAHTFRDWPALVSLLLTMRPDAPGDPPDWAGASAAHGLAPPEL